MLSRFSDWQADILTKCTRTKKAVSLTTLLQTHSHIFRFSNTPNQPLAAFELDSPGHLGARGKKNKINDERIRSIKYSWRFLYFIFLTICNTGHSKRRDGFEPNELLKWRICMRVPRKGLLNLTAPKGGNWEMLPIFLECCVDPEIGVLSSCYSTCFNAWMWSRWGRIRY